jgi:hypothetical protein
VFWNFYQILDISRNPFQYVCDPSAGKCVFEEENEIELDCVGSYDWRRDFAFSGGRGVEPVLVDVAGEDADGSGWVFGIWVFGGGV